MHLHTGYGVPDLTPTNFPIPDSSQQVTVTPQQFQLFWQHQHHHHHQQQEQPVNVDPNFASSFRVGMDHHHHAAAAAAAANAFPHNLLELVGGGLTSSYRPPPSVVVTPQPLRWINQEDQHPLLVFELDRKCDRIGIPETRIPAMNGPPSLLRFGDPEIDKRYSQSPGSVSEIYETHWPNPENEHPVKEQEEEKKKKEKNKCCTDDDEEEARLEKELKVLAGIIEGKLAAQQERLHRRFTAAIERMERERREREESWRAADVEMARVQAEARAREQALASSREAVIVSYLERISGEKIELPGKLLGDHQWMGESTTGDCKGRWPRVEVEALIGARSGMETRFQEPGLKAGLWEEVSRVMEGMGFRRSAKRCKEKWENINKYFRKAKEEEDHRPGKRMKTCSYFDKLDQHYNNSRSVAMGDGANAGSITPNSSSYNDDDKVEKCELLEVMLELQSNSSAHQLDVNGMDVIKNGDEVRNGGGGQEEDCNGDDGDNNG